MNSAEDTIIGLIAWDEDSENSTPKIITAQGEYSWEEFGRKLMTWEGCQFRLQMFDKDEKLD